MFSRPAFPGMRRTIGMARVLSNRIRVSLPAVGGERTAMEAPSEHAKGLVITAAGVLVLTPDSLLIRLITADQWTLLFWRGTLMALGLAVILAAISGRATAARFRAIGQSGILLAVLFATSSILFDRPQPHHHGQHALHHQHLSAVRRPARPGFSR